MSNPMPLTTKLTDADHLHCFAAVGIDSDRLAAPPWAQAWRRDVRAHPLRLADHQLQALARVVPLLVCGEQSAIAVFGGQAMSLTGAATAQLLKPFQAIEDDESGHELAWQTLHAQLPKPADLTQLKRRSQRFFARLGRRSSIGQHFAQVAQLDSAVGAMMWHLERSSVAAEPRLFNLANQVKRDEARHVAVSRRYAKLLGVPRAEYDALGDLVREELVVLLEPVVDALECIGVDSDAMFRRIAKRPKALNS